MVGIIVRSCKASQSPVYPIRDAILAVNHAFCPSSSSSCPPRGGESALKTSRLPGSALPLGKIVVAFSLSLPRMWEADSSMRGVRVVLRNRHSSDSQTPGDGGTG